MDVRVEVPCFCVISCMFKFCVCMCFSDVVCLTFLRRYMMNRLCVLYVVVVFVYLKWIIDVLCVSMVEEDFVMCLGVESPRDDMLFICCCCVCFM